MCTDPNGVDPYNSADCLVSDAIEWIPAHTYFGRTFTPHELTAQSNTTPDSPAAGLLEIDT